MSAPVVFAGHYRNCIKVRWYHSHWLWEYAEDVLVNEADSKEIVDCYLVNDVKHFLDKESQMLTCKLPFSMTSIESLEAELRGSFRVACRWAVQCSGKKPFVIKFYCAPLYNKHTIRYSVWMVIPTDADTKLADMPIIAVLSSSSSWLFDFCGFYFFFSSTNLASQKKKFTSPTHFDPIRMFSQSQSPSRSSRRLTRWWYLLDYPSQFESHRYGEFRSRPSCWYLTWCPFLNYPRQC